MTSLHAYLIFNGNCREAMTFYHECLGGTLSLETVKDSPMANGWPTEAQHKVLHATLQKDHLLLLATDMVERAGFQPGNNICLSLICKDEKEITTFFDKLSNGGTIKYPLHDFYGGKLGGLIDKFGINWMLKQ